MPSYQTLDTIADAYVPVLAVIILISIALRLAQPKAALRELACVLLLAIIAYGMMALDHYQRFWAHFGWDYSTHTATAAACAWYLFWLHKGKRIAGGFFHHKFVRLIWPISFGLYLGLMRYQGYHTWADMLTTLAALTPLFIVHKLATQ